MPAALKASTCTDDLDDKDAKGHQHKLETEGAGPTASNLVASNLTRLIEGDPDPVARIRRGRYVFRDGSLSRRPKRAAPDGGNQDAVAVWLADPGSDQLGSGSGKIVALPGIGSFGNRNVDATGHFMGCDGRFQDGPDATTRGMLTGRRIASDRRYYLNLYPALAASALGPAHGN